MQITTEIAKSLISPPGDTIQEHIDLIGMRQSELAERMGRPREKVNDLIKGREPISTPTAFQLEKVLGISAGFWLNREKNYRKELYELEQIEKFEKEIDWLKEFPIKAMQKLGWLPQVNDNKVNIDNLLKFFGVASRNEWERIFIDEKVSVAFRISLARTQSPHAISAWLRQGEIQAQELNLNSFDKKKFKESLLEIKELAFHNPFDLPGQLQSISANCGVSVVFTPNLPNAPISGASRWYHNKPLIQLSGRYKTDDHFWFTFFHEAAHIILHGKKDVFLEDVEGAETDSIKEKQADEFASKLLLNDNEWKQVANSLPYNENVIFDLAQKFRVPAGVIIGRLQFQKLIGYNTGNKFKRRIDLFEKN